MKARPTPTAWLWPLATALLATAAIGAEPNAVRDPSRDPMRAPSPAAAAGRDDRAPTPAADWQARQILRSGECRYVVERGRRYGVGDVLGGARIEAIDETSVLVREAGVARRVPLYAGVTKHTQPEPAFAAGATPPIQPLSPEAVARARPARCPSPTAG